MRISTRCCYFLGSTHNSAAKTIIVPTRWSCLMPSQKLLIRKSLALTAQRAQNERVSTLLHFPATVIYPSPSEPLDMRLSDVLDFETKVEACYRPR